MIEENSANTSCSQCNYDMKNEEIYCSNCGYPENGSQGEKSKYQLKLSSKKRLLSDADKKIKSAKKVLYILAGINVLFGIIFWATADDYFILVTSLIVAVLYLVLVAWTDKQPFAAILTGFILYITLVMVSAIDDPVNIVRGFIWKIIIISVFVKGIKSGLEAKRIKSELESFKIT